MHRLVGSLYARLFNAAGSRVGALIPIFTPARSPARRPAVASTSEGYVVLFKVSTGTPSPSVIKGQLVAKDGTRIGGNFQVNSNPFGLFVEPDVATNSNGRMLATWRDFDFNDGDIAARLFVLPTSCVASTTRLCLADGRFAVDLRWRTLLATEGLGNAVALTDDSGLFWFFDPNNIELVVKVLDACATFDRFWVFAAGLTNVEVDLTVTDTATGEVVTYHNPQAMPFQPVQDTSAFMTCP